MIMRRHACFVFLLAAHATGFLLLLDGQQPASIVVSAGQKLGPVNRLVFGQNIEAGDNAHIFSSETTNPDLIQKGDGFWDPANASPYPEVVAQSKAAGMSVLRYPGGCLAHNFDWRKTVGPDAKKSRWLFGLNEYLTLCSAIGAVPLITVSDYVLAAEQMPQHAAELVEYLNSLADAAHPWAMKRQEWGHPAPYDVRWFELGNESMHGNHRTIPHRQFTAEEYANYVNATAAAMRGVDPKIRTGIVMVPGAGTDVDCDWNHTVLHLAGKSADFVVIHMYAPQEPKTGVPENLYMQALMVAPQHVEQRLADYHRMIQRQVGHDLPLAITEFNGGLDTFGSRYRFSYGDALECADLLRVFLKPESNVAIASYWNFLNGAFGMLRTDLHSPITASVTEEPAFLLYELWAQHFGSELVKVEVQGPRGEFPGVGSEQAAWGSVPEARRPIQAIDLNKYKSPAEALGPKLPNAEIQRQESNFTINLHNLKQSLYPVLARIPRTDIGPASQVEFSLSFDAKLTPDPGSDTAPMGIGLMDSRGWSKTHSGIGLDAITTEWKTLAGTYRLEAQTPSVDVTARLMAEGKSVSGTLQIRNLSILAFVPAHDAAYPLLTSSASISSDGKKIYLIVFNKSATDSIPTTIHLAGFLAAGAQYWEVNGPALDSSSGVIETERGATIPLNDTRDAAHVFPSHSMTAMEFSRMR